MEGPFYPCLGEILPVAKWSVSLGEFPCRCMNVQAFACCSASPSVCPADWTVSLSQLPTHASCTWPRPFCPQPVIGSLPGILVVNTLERHSPHDPPPSRLPRLPCMREPPSPISLLCMPPMAVAGSSLFFGWLLPVECQSLKQVLYWSCTDRIPMPKIACFVL